MNILILGGTGFLGKNCARALSETHNVFVSGYENNSQIDHSLLSLKLSETDKIIDFIESNNIDLVMHLVSTLLPGSSEEDYIYDIQNVYNPTLTLLEYCAKNKIRLVFFSSGGVIYGNSDCNFSEEMTCNPISYYGLSKLNIENAISFYHRVYNLEYLIIRPSNPYGKGQNIYGRQGLIAVIMGKILNNQPIEIWGDGTAVKDYIYIDDFVFYIKALIEESCVWNTVFNIGSGVGTSVNDVIKVFENNNIILPKIKYLMHKNTDVSRMILNCNKLNKLIPHKCKSITEGVLEFWNYIKEDSDDK